MHLGILSIFSAIMWAAIMFRIYKKCKSDKDMSAFWVFGLLALASIALLVTAYISN